MIRLSFPIYPLSVRRTDAVLTLIAALFNATESEQHPAVVNSDALGAVPVELAAAQAPTSDYLEGEA